MREFYERYFGATAGSRYENPRKQFLSYFLAFDGGARLELMQSPAVAQEGMKEVIGGFAHIAVAIGSEQAVDALTTKLREDGYTVWTALGAQVTVTTSPSFWILMAIASRSLHEPYATSLGDR